MANMADNQGFSNMANIADNQGFSAVLRVIRANLNLTQEQLAERLGVSFTTVNRWEGGGTRPQKAAREAIRAHPSLRMVYPHWALF